MVCKEIAMAYRGDICHLHYIMHNNNVLFCKFCLRMVSGKIFLDQPFIMHMSQHFKFLTILFALKLDIILMELSIDFYLL